MGVRAGSWGWMIVPVALALGCDSIDSSVKRIDDSAQGRGPDAGKPGAGPRDGGAKDGETFFNPTDAAPDYMSMIMLPGNEVSPPGPLEDYALPHSTAETFLEEHDDGYATLAVTEWELEGNSEAYLCVRVTVPADTFLSEIASLSPLGTHHATLGVSEVPTTEDGVEIGCGPNVGLNQVFASGASTTDIVLPQGVAMKLPAGKQIELRLHLFNTAETKLEGKSGVLAKVIDESEVEETAGAVLAGPIMFSVPVGLAVQTGACVVAQDATIFNVFPHMHTLGVAMKIVAERSEGGDVTLFEGPYDFNEQAHYPVDMVQVKAGDKIAVECTYENDTGMPVGFGESTLQEMCFAGVSSFPPIMNGTICF